MRAFRAAATLRDKQPLVKKGRETAFAPDNAAASHRHKKGGGRERGGKKFASATHPPMPQGGEGRGKRVFPSFSSSLGAFKSYGGEGKGGRVGKKRGLYLFLVPK